MAVSIGRWLGGAVPSAVAVCRCLRFPDARAAPWPRPAVLLGQFEQRAEGQAVVPVERLPFPFASPLVVLVGTFLRPFIPERQALGTERCQAHADPEPVVIGAGEMLEVGQRLLGQPRIAAQGVSTAL